ncbi:MAG: pseudaminic acid synthase [Rikenellaceae bacterium]|nr:pseudaminic acid synthase [Rikenellaceae bacterium]
MPGSHTFIVAELSANHNQNINTAISTIKAAKKAGADAVKLQTYTPDTITINCDNKYFRIGHGTLWDGRTLYDLYKEAYTPWEWHENLFRVVKEEGMVCFSSPFDCSAVDFLESLDNPIYKIASFEITDIPLIEYAASKGKPMIISTGIATMEEIAEAVEACRRVGNPEITLLKCTSAYPADISDAGLSIIPDLRQRFGVKVGISDHTLGNTVPVVGVGIGAVLIEKHLTLDRSAGGVDSAFSMEPEEFAGMVGAVRDAERALGAATYTLSERALQNRKFARSLFVVRDMRRGDVITDENVRSIRPSDGLSPKYLPVLMGKKVAIDIKRGTPLEFDMLDM